MTVVAVGAGLGCAGQEAKRPLPTTVTQVRLTTGMPGAGFHPLGTGLAKGYERVLPLLDFVIQESPGSVRNVRTLHSGAADIGFAFADVAYMAYVGQLAEDPTRFDRLRGMAVLQLTPVQVVARSGVGIRSIRDLRGHRVGTGPPGSGTALTSGLLMRAFGILPDQVMAETLPFNEAADKLVDGTLDAIFVNAGYPSEAVEIATRSGGRLLAVDGHGVARLRSDYPFLRFTFIPGGTYPSHADAIATIGVDSLLLCRVDLDEGLVYDLTKAFFEVLPQLSTERASLQLMNVDRASATPIPLHPGAARYYRELELSR